MFGFVSPQLGETNAYFQMINNSVQLGNEAELRCCFTINLSWHWEGNKLVSFCENQQDLKQYTNLVEDKLIEDLTVNHLYMLKYLSSNVREAVVYQMKMLRTVCSSEMINNLKPIYIPLIVQILKETLQLIKQTRLRHPIFDVKMNSDYSQYVRGFISNLKNDNTVRYARLIVTAYNCFIKSCFHQLNYKACQDIYESFKEEIPKQLDFSPKDEICAYYYYRGRICMYSEKYEEAVSHFNKALDFCDASHRRNVSRILFFLIPLKMRDGFLPPQSLLDEYHFDLLSQITKCLQSGDVGTMKVIVDTNRDLIIKRGLFLVMNQLQARVQANLVIRTVHILNSVQLPFSVLQFAFQWYGIVLNNEELVWLINSLCHLQLIKCRIYITPEKVVFSKDYLP